MSEVWKRETVDSPCINICLVHPATRLCTGCARTIEEISAWSRMTPEARQQVMEELPHREPVPKTRRGGRNARLARRVPDTPDYPPQTPASGPADQGGESQSSGGRGGRK